MVSINTGRYGNKSKWDVIAVSEKPEFIKELKESGKTFEAEHQARLERAKSLGKIV
jgi:hypothetical protein